MLLYSYHLDDVFAHLLLCFFLEAISSEVPINLPKRVFVVTLDAASLISCYFVSVLITLKSHMGSNIFSCL